MLIGLAAGELWASLFDHLWARCWIQFTTALVFAAYVILLMAKGFWLISPRDYIIFMVAAGFSFIRLRKEISNSKAPRRRRITDFAFMQGRQRPQ